MSDFPTLRHFGYVKDGEVYLYDFNLYQRNLQALEGKQVYQIVEEKFEETTPEEHGYYRGGIIRTIASDESFKGWSRDEIHQFLSDKFLGYNKEKIIKGVPITIRIVPSTAQIGKKRMAEYIEKVIAFASSIGIEIKPPDHYHTHKYGT